MPIEDAPLFDTRNGLLRTLDGDGWWHRPSSGPRARLTLALRAGVAALLLGLLLSQLGGARALVVGLGAISLQALAAALLANTADRLLMAWKWTDLLRARGHRLPLLRATRIYCSAMVWGAFLPATMGSDVVRGIATVRSGIPPAEVLASIVVERALGLLAGLLVGILALLAVSLLGELPGALAPLGWVGGLALLGAACGLALSFSDRAFDAVHDTLLGRFRDHGIARRLRSLHRSYRAFRDEPAALRRFFALSLLEQFGPVVPVWILALDQGLEVPLLYLAGAMALASLISRVPVSLGGIGVLEGVLVVLLTLVGVPTSLAVTIAVSARLVEIASWLPWWLSSSLFGSATPRVQPAGPGPSASGT